MQKDISKTIHFRFYNKFTKQDAVIVDIPFLPFLAISGHYSRLFKQMKDASAFECNKQQMIAKVWFSGEKNDRTIITMASGIKLNMPYDVTEKDVKIIKHHLQGLKMAIE